MFYRSSRDFTRWSDAHHLDNVILADQVSVLLGPERRMSPDQARQYLLDIVSTLALPLRLVQLVRQRLELR